MMNGRLRRILLEAYRSSFYRDRWRAAGIRPDRLRGLEDFRLLPFVTRRELFEALRNKRGKIACRPANTWFAGSSPANRYEWFPFSARDFLGISPMLERMSRVVGLQAGDIVLAVVDTTPRISSVIPYLWTHLGSLGSPRLEFIVGSLDWYDTMGMTWIDFVQRRRPTVLFTSTEKALALADKIQEDRGTQAKAILRETRVGIFYGEPLADCRARIMEAYDLEPYEVYSPTEHMRFFTECRAHRGIHVWMDTCLPEIIPLDSEDALPLWEASAGTKGKLVITNFAECLPLVRYNTEESIIVESIQRCACGRTHPRISRLPSDNKMQA
jgi:phenylacetate-CoA ligase